MTESASTICAECGKPAKVISTYGRTVRGCDRACYWRAFKFVTGGKYGRECLYCHKAMTGRMRKFCDHQCANPGIRMLHRIKTGKLFPKEIACWRCNCTFRKMRGQERYCHDCKPLAKQERNRRDWAKGQKKKRAMRKGAAIAVRINPEDIFNRDNWTCQRCAVRCLKRASITHPRKANMDHIIPLSKGGNHVPENVQTLCRACNQTKRNHIGGDQLRLVG